MIEHEYSQGICGDGAAILKNGQPMTIEEIVQELKDGQAARAQGGQEEDGKGSLPWFVHVYNSGYEAGHHDTVEGGFTPIHFSDQDTYHEELVLEILEDLNVQASRGPQPAQQGSVPEVPTEQMLNEGVTALTRGLKTFGGNYTQIVNNIWEDMAALLSIPATPQPEGDGWIKCSERLPTEADADCDGYLWVCWYDRGWRTDREYVNEIDCEYYAWKPTGLKRPQPPQETSHDNQ